MKVAVVDYGSGNLASASRALTLAAERAGLAAEVKVTADPGLVAGADRIVLPGQGAFADCARGLAAVAGMREAIESATARGTPFLGICVGMQLMAERGLEHDVTPGFGWIAGEIAEMAAPGLRLPQMGWNALDFTPGAHTLLDGLVPGDHVYFVHSYALVGRRPGTNDRDDRLWRSGGGHGRRRQPRRHAVPCRKEPGGRPPHPRQFPALDALSRWPDDRRPAQPTRAIGRARPEFTDEDLHALCEATDAAIIDGGGFGWVNPPGRRALETLFPRRAAGA